MERHDEERPETKPDAGPNKSHEELQRIHRDEADPKGPDEIQLEDWEAEAPNAEPGTMPKAEPTEERPQDE